jgi:hypothetical protein
MDDPTPQPDRPSSLVCPWCSTSVTPQTETCPTCGAVLIGDEETVVPGITAVDEKIVRGETRPQDRSRLLSWISGEYADESTTEAEAQAIAPPDPAVQREIRRLQLEAEIANLTAEVQARRVEAVVDVIDEGDPAAASAAVAALETVEAQDAEEIEAVRTGVEIDVEDTPVGDGADGAHAAAAAADGTAGDASATAEEPAKTARADEPAEDTTPA